MTFRNIITEVIAWLQQDGRISYRVLKRQFDLDDADLEDLKDGLLFAYPVVDEDGRGLVWTGDHPTPKADARPSADAEHRFRTALLAVIMLLQRDQRVTYRTLKNALGINGALLTDIRQELRLRRLAIDEAGEVLVWTGETRPSVQSGASSPSQQNASATATISPASLAPQSQVAAMETVTNGPPASPLDAPIEPSSEEQTTIPQPVRSAPDAERRQLTVMFCDLVGSTDLSGRLDPEDLREVVQAYQETAAGVIERYDGHIAQYLGDGLLVYFGYPVAHEDDAQRAVHTGLGIVEAMGALNMRLEAEHSVELAVRIGIHTGPVVVGEMGGGGRHENLALGETPNIAARLEGLAQANTAVLSPVTAQLVQRAFVLEERGSYDLKGVAEPMMLYTVVGFQTLDYGDDGAITSGFDSLVGRDEEIGLILRRWEQSKAGLGQVIWLSGEAGIGKSSLIEGLRGHVHQEGFSRIAFRCSPYYTNSAFYPIIEYIQRTMDWQPDDLEDAKLIKLEQQIRPTGLPMNETIPLLAGLLTLSLPDNLYPVLGLSPQEQRQQLQDVLLTWLSEKAEHQPMLIVWEDLHWSDPSTLDTLKLFIDQAPATRILHVLTFRPEFEPPWPSRSHMTPITLNRLERPQVEALITKLTNGRTLPGEVIRHIVEKTDGVPLYVEELTKMLLVSDSLRQESGCYVLTGPLQTAAIPDTLQDSLMARLDQMQTAKEVAQLGAVLGREFAYDMIEAISSQPKEVVQAGLSQLVEAELLYQRGRPPRAKYIFKHALVQDTAYASLLRRTRQHIHRQIAELLEAQYPETASAQPELIAYHYTEGNRPIQAITYWQRAIELSRQRHAHPEAIEQCMKGLAILPGLPAGSETVQYELKLQTALGASLIVVRGFHSTEMQQVYERAWQLCQQIGDTANRFPILVGLCTHYLVTADLHLAQEFANKTLRSAEGSLDANQLTVAHYLAGAIAFLCGDFQRAAIYTSQGITHYNREHHRTLIALCNLDPGVGCYLYYALALQLLGYADQAVRQLQIAIRLAKNLNHPFTFGYALAVSLRFYWLRQDWKLLMTHANLLYDYADEHSFTSFSAISIDAKGYVLVKQGHVNEGMIMLQQRRTQGGRGRHGFVQLETCQIDLVFSQQNQVLEDLTNLLNQAEQSGGHGPVAEFYRLKGEVLLELDATHQPQAEACFHQALDFARRQEAKSWELRAATSLAKLWQSQGKRQEAYELLTPVYRWFTEGFDTADLIDAKRLLDELEGSRP